MKILVSILIAVLGLSHAMADSGSREQIFLSRSGGNNRLVVEKVRLSDRGSLRKVQSCHYARGLKSRHTYSRSGGLIVAESSSTRTRLVEATLADDAERAMREFKREHMNSSRRQRLADENGNIDLFAVAQYHTDRSARFIAEDLIEIARTICGSGG